MKKQFKPVIKHDEVTQTYTIRDKHGVVIQVPDTLIDRLDSQYSKLETQKTAFERSYKQVVEENNKLKQSVSDYKDYAESRVANYLEFRALEEENKVLRSQEKTYFDECQNAKKELKDYQDDYEMVTNNCIYWEDKAHWLEDESSKYIEYEDEIKEELEFIRFEFIGNQNEMYD
ncbi:hypothetical protein [Staphylococcus phage vB_SsapH-Golestan101-M]|nr:hypothetical protein [Staphylococcus phage vB_SsapH-Golestan101-M]